jgi:hypothetical protein
MYTLSRDSSVSIETGYELEAGVRFPVREKNFSILNSVQTDPGCRLPSYPSPRVKRPGCEADHLPPSSAEVKVPHTSMSTWLN